MLILWRLGIRQAGLCLELFLSHKVDLYHISSNHSSSHTHRKKNLKGQKNLGEKKTQPSQKATKAPSDITFCSAPPKSSPVLPRHSRVVLQFLGKSNNSHRTALALASLLAILQAPFFTLTARTALPSSSSSPGTGRDKPWEGKLLFLHPPPLRLLRKKEQVLQRMSPEEKLPRNLPFDPGQHSRCSWGRSGPCCPKDFPPAGLRNPQHRAENWGCSAAVPFSLFFFFLI